MAEANPETGTITDEADLMDMLFEEPGANQGEDDQTAPNAEVAEGVEPEVTEEPEQIAESAKFTVKIDGKDEQVTQDELLAGYQRQADYTRKTQEIAQQREQITSGTAELKNALQFWATPQQQEPDWADLAQKMPPQEFNQARARWEQVQRRSQEAKALLGQITRQEQSATLQREQAALLNRIPEWRDKAAAQKELSAIVTTAAEFGFSEQEVGAVVDHRVLLMARELARLKGADMALKTQRQAVPPKTVTPAARPAAQDVAARNAKQLDNLKRSGSDEAAVAYLLGG